MMLTKGKKYKVEFEDCCVAGDFEAVLDGVDQDEEFVYWAHFDNGVTLETVAGVNFTLV